MLLGVHNVLQVLLPGVLAAAITTLLTPAVIRLAVKLRAFDVPGGRKHHGSAIPRLGGIAIVAGIAIPVVLSLTMFSDRAARSLSPSEIFGYVIAILIVLCLGIVDDLRGVGPFQKLFFQLAAAALVVALGWRITRIWLPLDGRFEVGALAPFLSILWIVGVTNAINFTDGLDGLAAGIVAIISTSLMIFAVMQSSPQTVVAMSSIAGACLGFLRHNWRPARIYMGDSGSLTLGFLLATISLRSSPSVKASTAVAILVPILALGMPVFDTLLVMWYRLLRGHRTRNFFARLIRPDRSHLHHLLHDNRPGRPEVMPVLYGVTAGCCLMALLVATSRSLKLGIGFLAVEFAAVLLIRRAGLKAEARRLTSNKLSAMDHAAVGTPRGAIAQESQCDQGSGTQH